MRIIETGYDRPLVQIHHPGRIPSKLQNLFVRSNLDKSTVFDRDSLSKGSLLILGGNLSIVKYEVCLSIGIHKRLSGVDWQRSRPPIDRIG